MKRRTWLWGLSCASVAACAGAPPPLTTTPEAGVPPHIERNVQQRGMLAYTAFAGGPLTSLALALRVGHRHEPAGREGLAVLVGNVLVGAPRDPASLASRLATLGARPKLFVTADLLAIVCTVQHRHVERALHELLATLDQPLSADVFERCRAEQDRRIRSQQGDLAHVVGLGLLLAHFGHEPPSGLLELGTPTSLAALDRAAAQDWLDRLARADQAILAAAGSSDLDALAAMVERSSATWLTRDQAQAPASEWELEQHNQPRTVAIVSPRAARAIVAFGTRRHPGTKRALVERMIDRVIASIIHHELRTDARMTYGVESKLWATKYGGFRQFSAIIAHHELGRAVQRVHTLLLGLDRISLGEDTLESAIRLFTLERASGLQTTEQLLGDLLELAETGDSPEQLAAQLAELRSLDAEGLSMALQLDYPRNEVSMAFVGTANALEYARDARRKSLIERTPDELIGIAS